MNNAHVFVGMRSTVICLNEGTGEIVWKRELGAGFGEGFVSLALSEKKVFAHTRGELHCLDRKDGTLLWTNRLEGLGFGTAFVCTDSTPAHYVDALLKIQSMRSSGG